MDNFRLKKDQFGPRSIEEIRADMSKAKSFKFGKKLDNQPKNTLETRSKIDNMNNLRKRTWR